MTEKYGADTGRLFILFIGPPDEDAEWNDRGAEGMYRFLNRVWRLFEGNVTVGMEGEGRDMDDYSPSDRELLRKVHLTIRKVTDDIERFHFNTAVSAVMFGEYFTALAKAAWAFCKSLFCKRARPI